MADLMAPIESKPETASPPINGPRRPPFHTSQDRESRTFLEPLSLPLNKWHHHLDCTLLGTLFAAKIDRSN